MFAALLGYNPIRNLLAPYGVLSRLPAHNVAVLTGRQFFPHLISAPFHHGLVIVFTAAAIMSFLGAMVSLLRGKQFYFDENPMTGLAAGPALTVPATPNGSGPNGHAAAASNDDSAAASQGPSVGDG
jgi:hypothetical protein